MAFKKVVSPVEIRVASMGTQQIHFIPVYLSYKSQSAEKGGSKMIKKLADRKFLDSNL